IEILRAREDVKAFEAESELADAREQRGRGLDIDAELLRAAAHAHARPLELEVGVETQRDARAQRKVARDRREQLDFTRRLDVDENARGSGLAKLRRRLARPREADLRRHRTCV